MADHFIFANGILCYTVGHTCLRILALHGLPAPELEICTRQLILEAVGEVEDDTAYNFRPLHISHDVVSCVYSTKQDNVTAHYLVILLTSPLRVLPARRLESLRGLFVRNDNAFLYYGVRTEAGENRYRHYVLWGLDLRTQDWDSDRLVLWDFYGSDFGQTASFEIFDGCLYGITGEGPLHSMENKWNSFYTSFRFVLGQHMKIQYLPEQLAWRRQWQEGLIDDRWSQIELSKDEASGQLYVYETRREWPPGGLPSQRTCYRKELNFPPMPAQVACSTSDDETIDDTMVSGWDGENHYEERRFEDVYAGDSGLRSPSHANSLIRTYNVSGGAFVDLVRDSCDQPTTKTLRLRTLPRLHTPNVSAEQNSNKSVASEKVTAECGISRPCSQPGVWPPIDSSEPLLAMVQKVLNPVGNEDEIDSMAVHRDERNIVYMPLCFRKRRLLPVVLVSFDPGLHLPGLPSLSRDDETKYCWPPPDTSTLATKFLGISRSFGWIDILLEPLCDPADWTREDGPLPSSIEGVLEDLPMAWAKWSGALYRSLFIGTTQEATGFHLSG